MAPGSGVQALYHPPAMGGNDFGPGGPSAAAPDSAGRPAGGGAGGVAGEHGTTGRGAAVVASRSAAGLGGVPIGAGRGDGEQDGVHRRPAYLVEPDAKSLFGTDELTAPPVIGVG